MPTVNVDVETLYSQIGKQMSILIIDQGDKEFEDLCFDFGIELEEIGTSDDGKKIFKIDIPANRYDMLCVEGIASALAVYLGLKSVTKYQLSSPKKLETIHVESSVY